MTTNSTLTAPDTKSYPKRLRDFLATAEEHEWLININDEDHDVTVTAAHTDPDEDLTIIVNYNRWDNKMRFGYAESKKGYRTNPYSSLAEATSSVGSPNSPMMRRAAAEKAERVRKSHEAAAAAYNPNMPERVAIRTALQNEIKTAETDKAKLSTSLGENSVEWAIRQNIETAVAAEATIRICQKVLAQEGQTRDDRGENARAISIEESLLRECNELIGRMVNDTRRNQSRSTNPMSNLTEDIQQAAAAEFVSKYHPMLSHRQTASTARSLMDADTMIANSEYTMF